MSCTCPGAKDVRGTWGGDLRGTCAVQALEQVVLGLHGVRRPWGKGC